MALRLKNLELNGYKTFATKTAFEFSGNITAVVGPNGSGKSNIADSLRWVLGEQSYKLLRGRKTDDMIFAGSETRSRSGMASATVTFDNSEGWLPIDFSEVSITRRAYRDGNNEYLINNQRVRLIDVTELLSKSGLSERTYTVIGQGLVDTALSLKADERRRLFEEAAGIGLYRRRKELSLRRLDTTKRNLERVQDILAELSPRLKSLERQARRAKEYDQVRDDLQEILREWYGFHWHKTQQDLLRSRSAAQIQEGVLQAARTKQESYDQELSAIRDQVNGLRGRLNAWHRQLAQIHIQREETSRDLAVSNERQRSLVERKTRLATEFTRAQEDLSREQVRLEDVQRQVEQFQAEAHEAEAQAREARQALGQRQAARRSAEEDIKRAQMRITELTTRQAELKARKVELENRIESQASSTADTQAVLEQARQALSGSEERLTRTQAEAEQAEAHLQQIEDSLEQKKQTVESLAEQRRSYQAAQAEQEGELARAKAQLDVLEKAEMNLTGYADGAKLLLEAARQGQLAGVQGALSSHLTVAPEYEQAISAALGDYLDAVLVQVGEDIDQALQLLESDPGKAALLPLNLLNPPAAIQSPRIEGCIGLAADLVQATPELRPVIDLLLGQVLIVQDRKVARQVLRGQPPQVSAVSLNGEVFYSSGAIRVDSKGGASTLSRPRERQELKEKIEQTQARIDALQKRFSELDQQETRLKSEIKDTGQQLDTAQEQADKTHKAFQSASLEADQVRNTVEWHQGQLSSLHESAFDAEQQIGQIGSQTGRLQEDLAQAQETLRQRTQELNTLILDELQEQVTHWEAETAVSQRVLADAHKNLEERQAAVDKVRQEIQSLNEQQGQVDEKLSSLKGQVEEMRTSEGGIGEQISELQVLIDPAEEELRQAEAKQIELEKTEAEARGAMNMAERRHSQAQIALARTQESLESIRQRIEDDFGLVEFSYEDEVSGPTPLPLGDLVERLPVVTEISPDLEQTLKRNRVQLRRMGSINPEAHQEYVEVKDRYEFLLTQMDDLQQAEKDIREVLVELDALMGREFRKTFEVVAAEFREIFGRLFPGGSARLMLTDEENLNESGVDIEARLPGKRMQRLAVLSGGERAMTAVALVFALIKASPTPFCVLDEVDAALDEANIERLREILMELSGHTQFVIITHNRNTVQVADLIYGITMGRDTTSQMISLRLEDVDERYSE